MGICGLWWNLAALDVVKTQLMLDKDKKAEEAGWWNSLDSIYERYGITGLYLGTLPRFGLCFIGGGFYFWAEQFVKGFL